MSQNFKNLPLEELAEVLRQFYGTVLSNNGKEYSCSGMINLRSALNRHLHSPPYSKSFDLMNDRDSLQASLVFTGRLRDNKEKGLDTSAPCTAMEKEDLNKLFEQYFPWTLGDFLDTEVLLHKVFFDIMYYTGHHGKEGLWDLSKNSFVIKEDANWKEFIDITFN